MSDNGQTIQIPEFVLRQVGTLQLQLALSQDENQRLTQQLAAATNELAEFRASSEPETETEMRP